MKSHSKRILSLVFALLMAFQQVMFAAQTVDLLTPAEKTETVDLLTGGDENETVDILTPAEPSAPIEQSQPIIEENKVNENQTVDIVTPRDDEIVPTEGKKSTTTILIGGEEDKENPELQDEDSDLTPVEIKTPDEDQVDEEEKKDATFEDEEHHENAGILPWSTDLVKPWSIYREPKKVYRPGEDLDLTELLVEIKTGRSGSLYNIEDLINDEFTTITRTRKSDGEKVRLDDKIYEDETMTIHMDGCQDLTIDFTVDENLKDEEEALEAFQENFIREEIRDGLDFSLYLIKKGERENPVVAYSLDPHKLTPIGNGVDKKLKDGPLFDLKDINTWDRFDIETIGKVKAILERSAEIENENVRKKLITQLAIWNVTSNLIPQEIDATVSEIEETETTELGPELKPTEEEAPEEKEEEPIEIIDPTTPEEEIESVEQVDEVEAVEEKTEIEKTTEIEEPAEEKTEAEEPVEENTEENKESEKIETKAPVQSTVHKIVFDVREIDLPYDEVELSDEEYALYNELTSLEAIELKSEDEDLKIYEPIIEETENPYADLVTIGESDIDSIERVETEVTFDAVDYSFQNLYHTLETSSMLGFGQPRDFNVLLKATMKASRKIVEGDKFEVEILSKTLPILNGEEGRANDIQIDGKVVATAEYIAEEHKIVYTFVEDLDTDKVEIEQEFKQIKEEKAALLNMLDVSENLVLDAVRGAEGDEDSEENPDELEISPEDDNAAIKLVLGNTPVQYNGVSFETKKFRLKTTMTAKAAPVWKIPKDWTFDVNIGPYLKPEYDENSEPILKPLYDPNYPGKEIATPSYIENEDGHIIRYTFNNSITETKKLDIDQLLAFDTEAIGDKDKINIDITVKPKDNPTQKMQPIIVRRDDPRTVIPSIFEIDVNGNGEPNFNDTYEFFEYGPSYKVTFDAKSTPVVENRKMTAIDWEITFDGHGRKLGEEDLKLITNFTAVENSGIEKIENVKLNDSDENIALEDNTMGDKFLINDSKNVVGKQSSDKYVFTFTTKVNKQQQAYVLDISAKLKGINKTGAVRLFQPYIDTIDLSYESPTILKCSNRVTNSGEFLSENKIRWILTEEVSSGDAGKLPVATRTLSGNQQIESSKVSYYILNNVDGNEDDGKMQKVGETLDLNKKILEEGKLKENETFPPGTIAVYEIITTIKDQNFEEPNFYSFGDNVISLYRDYDVNITWTSQVAGEKFPEETLYLKEKKVENEQIYYGHTYETVVKAQEDGEELNPDGKISKVENVKKWKIVNGKPEEIKYELSQKFGNESAEYRGIVYKELTNSFNIYDKRYEVLNTIAKKGEFKTANITVLKRDASDTTKTLAGAKFSLIGDGSQGISYSGVTDIDGKIAFNDVAPGTYVLQEEMAPEGYRINRQQDIVTVDDKGNVKWTKNNIETENIELPYDADGKYATECLYHNGSDIYPSYMNALSYATVEGKNINYYIYLKPDVKSAGNGTDQNTILAINYDNYISKEGGLYNIPVKIYDVNPNNRAVVQEAFKKKEIEKTFNSIIPEGKLSHSNYSIVPGNTKINNSKFSLSIPKERFAGDWGFVLKFTLKLNNDRLDSNLWYNWVTDFNHNDSNGILDNESGYRKTFIPKAADRKSGEGLANSPELLIYNEQKDAYPIVVVTKDDERKILSNVELTLIDKTTNNIIRVGRTDKEGVCKFENVPEGEYLLKETEVPNGLSKYNLNYNITVNHDGTIKYLVTDEVGKPVEPGEKYLIGIIQDPTVAEEGQKPEIKVLENSMKLNETSGWGQKRGVWEENAYEAYDFRASFLISNSKEGEKIIIDFDDNWNVTQWSGSMPNIVTRDGHVVATAELDTNTNKLTYTLTDYVNGKSAINASLFIQSIRPSKYYVLTDKNPDGTAKKYEFNDEIITPTESVLQKTIVEPDLGPYFGENADNSPLFITQNVDVTRIGKDLELRNVTVFNPDGKTNLVSDKLYIYYGMTNEARVAEDSNRIEPAYKPKKIVVYKVNKKGNNPNRILLPVNSGIKPEDYPTIYNSIAEFTITEEDIKNGQYYESDGVTLSYDEKRVDIKTNKVPHLNTNIDNVQFIFNFKDVDSGAGYVIEEFYDVTDEPAFRNNYILTSTYYHSKWSNKGGIAQMKPKSNAASADDGIIIDSGDPNKDLTIFHYRNKNRFIVKKVKKANNTVEPLANAWFTLKDKNGNLIKEDSSNINGIIVFDNLKPGTYYLTESVAPNGYSKLDKTVTVVVNENGTVEFQGHDDPNIEIISDSKTVKKYKKIYKEEKFEQLLTKQSRFPNFMNISSKILKNSSKIFNDNDDFVTSRIYLNPLDNSTSGKGPDKDTKLFLNASYAKSTDITLYKIPKAEKGNIDGYIANNPYAKIDITNNSEVKKMPDGSIWFRGPEDSRWNGDGYVIDITAKYGELKYEPGQRKEVDRIVDYTWIYETDNTFVRGRVGVKSILSSLELADQTQTGDDIYEVPENDGAVIQVTNKPDKAKVTIVKIDEENPEQKLSGAVFKLFDENGEEIKRDDQPYTVTTGEDGKATFDELEPGKTYLIKEETAPKGYEKTNKTWKVVVGENKTVKVDEKEIKQFFDIIRPEYSWIYNYSDAKLFGDGYPRNVLEVYSTIENKNDDIYSIKFNFVGRNNSEAHSNLKLDFDNDNFEFYDDNINSKGTYEEKVKFNREPGLLEFRFKPKSNLNMGDYTPLKNVRYVDFDMDKSFLPKLTKTGEKELTLDITPKTNPDNSEFIFNLSNKFKGFEVEFTKFGKDTNGDVFLSGAVFELKIKDGESYKDPVEGKPTTATSDKDGKVRFFNLKPGSYQIFETITPDGYKKPEGPVKEFIIEEDGTVKVKTKEGFKTFDEDKNAFNIINLKPGDGKFKIIKTDGNGNILPGIKFELYNSAGKVTINGQSEFVTDDKGEIYFENLPYDKYYIKEVSTEPGYILDDRERVVIIGNQWAINAKGKDVSDLLELDKDHSKMKTYKGLTRNDKKLLKPNTADVIIADLAYKVKLGGKINEGDTFTIYAGDNVDVDGIGLSENDEYDLYGPAGLLAKAEIDKSRNKIHYTFTEYAKHYNITDINLQVLLAVNRQKVLGGIEPRDEGFEEITVNISNTNIDPKNIDPSKVLSENFDVLYEYGKYPDGSPFDINACLVRFYEHDKTFDVYYYINNRTDGRKKTYSRNKRLKFTSNAKITIDSIDSFKLEEGSAFPWSFGFNLNKNSDGSFVKDIRTEYGLSYYSNYYKYDQYGNYYAYLNYNEGDNDTYLVKVSGKVTDNTVSKFRLTCDYTNQFWNGSSYENGYEEFSVLKKLEFGKSTGDGVIKVSIPNYKNKIEYTKVDGSIAVTAVDTKTEGSKQEGSTEGADGPVGASNPVFASSGNPLKGAEFVLKKDGSDTPIKDSKRESDKNGKFSWEGLAPGTYEVWETKAPDGYPTPKEKVSHFTVNEKGEIVGIKDNMKIIINEKIKPNIEFQKVDGSNKEKTVVLPGAEFTLYKAKKDTNGEYEKVDGALQFGMVDNKFNILPDVDDKGKQIPEDKKNGYKVTSDADGKFKFEKLEDGIYAVKETKAPAGYSKLLDYVFYFKVEGGKIYRVNELGNYIDSNKKDVKEENKDKNSLIVDMEKDTAQANPIEIENFKAEYPATGGVGALPFVFIGMMIMMVGAYMFIRRRDALYE